MNRLSQILASVKSHARKPYLLNLSDDARFALEYLLYQEQARVEHEAGKRYLTDEGKLKRVHGVQRPDIVSRALIAELKRYHEWEHNADEDESHPAPELVGIVKADGQCPICDKLLKKPPTP